MAVNQGSVIRPDYPTTAQLITAYCSPRRWTLAELSPSPPWGEDQGDGVSCCPNRQSAMPSPPAGLFMGVWTRKPARTRVFIDRNRCFDPLGRALGRVKKPLVRRCRREIGLRSGVRLGSRDPLWGSGPGNPAGPLILLGGIEFLTRQSTRQEKAASRQVPNGRVSLRPSRRGNSSRSYSDHSTSRMFSGNRRQAG